MINFEDQQTSKETTKDDANAFNEWINKEERHKQGII